MKKQVECNNITHIGVKPVVEALKRRNIKGGGITLLLGWNKIGDAGAKSVAEVVEMGLLTKLSLESNDIESDGAISLRDAMQKSDPSNSDLHTLNIAWNKIGNEGANMLGDVIALGLKKIYIGTVAMT